MLLMLLEEAGTGLGYGGEEVRKTALNTTDKVSNQSKQKDYLLQVFLSFFPYMGKMPRVWKEPFEGGKKNRCQSSPHDPVQILILSLDIFFFPHILSL